MANVFDQFDAAPSQAAPPLTGNVFDQFDTPAAPARSGEGRAASDVANPFDQAGGSASFNERFNAAPMASATDISSGLGAGLRREADEMLVGAPNAQNIAAAGTLRALNTAGLNIPRALGSAMQSLPLVGNGRGYSENYEAAKEREEAYARQAPYAAGLGTATGIVGGALALPSLQAAKGAGLLGRSVANAATGAGYAAVGELVDNQDLGKALQAGGIGFAAGGLLTPAAEYAIKGAQALTRSPYFSGGARVQNEAGELTTTAKAALRKEGIDPDQITDEGRAMMALAFSRKGETPAAMREAVASEFGIPLSRGQATGDARALELEAAALAGDRGTKAQGVGRDFGARQRSAIETARQDIGERVGRGVQIENPTQAAEVIADQAREYSTRASREAAAAEQAAQDALGRVRGPNPLDPVDAAARVRQGLVDEANASRARYRGSYEHAAALPGEFNPKVFEGLGKRVADRLGSDLPIDPVVTPGAYRALADLDKAPEILGLANGSGATGQHTELLRRRISNYTSNARQNPADMAALTQIRNAYDDLVGGAAETGQFGVRSAPQAPAAAAVDDFPGFALSGLPDPATAIPGGAGRAGAARQAEPESLAVWAGKVGLPYDAETRAADFHRVPVAGYGTLARKNAPTWDQLRVKAMEAGFISPDEAGAASAASIKDKILNAVQDERINGRKVFRLEDETGAGSRRALDRVADENADNAVMVDRQARRMMIDLEGAGLRPQDIDRAALNDAAETMLRTGGDDAFTAYERSVNRLGETGQTGRASSAAADDVPFPELGEGFAPAPAGSALPVATPEGREYAERFRLARSQFRDHKMKFSPQGAGDDVGRFMRSTVDWNAEPVEISRKLYAGNPGMNMRIADRVRNVLGEQSDGWAALQQGFISNVVTGRDMSPKAISDRIGAALTGEKRALAFKVLSDEQVRGLRDFQTAARTAQAARQQLPDWIETLGRSDFDPNRITGDLFGAGIPGSRPGSALYAGALKRFVGEDSAEWSGLRQAAWRRLVETPDGSAGLPPHTMAQRIREFVDGKGAGLARKMFSPEELAEFRRFGTAVQATVTPNGVPRPNGGGRAGQIVGKALDGIAAALGFQAGGLPAAGAVYTGRFGTRLLQDGFAARAARQSFEGGAPRAAGPRGPVLDLRPVGVGSGLAAEYGL